MKKASRARLNPYNLDVFDSGTLFDRLARTICAADCLPRKELFEAWEFARRVNRKLKGGRLVDLACGHGLVAYCLMLLDKRIPNACAVDKRIPLSAGRITQVLEKTWPGLAGRVEYLEMPLQQFEIRPDDLVVSAHACGAMTDTVLEMAMEVGARVAVLPCCHSEDRCDTGSVDGWVDLALAIDVTRAARLRAAGYTIYTTLIPDEITPKNRVLVGYRGEPKREIQPRILSGSDPDCAPHHGGEPGRVVPDVPVSDDV